MKSFTMHRLYVIKIKSYFANNESLHSITNKLEFRQDYSDFK